MGNTNGGGGNDLFRKGMRPQGYGGDMAGADLGSSSPPFQPPPPPDNAGSSMSFNQAPGVLGGASNGGFLDSLLANPNPNAGASGAKSIDPNSTMGLSFGNAVNGPAAGVLGNSPVGGNNPIQNSGNSPLSALTPAPPPPPVQAENAQLQTNADVRPAGPAAGIRRPGMRPNAQADNPQFNSSGATSGRRGGRGNRRGRLNMF